MGSGGDERLTDPSGPEVEVLYFDGCPNDVDPYSEERTDYGLSYRVFRTEAGIVGQPDERWVRDAFAREGEPD